MEKIKTMKAETRGRKPVQDKKQQVTIYVKKSVIERNGGLDKTKSNIIDYLTFTAIMLICLFAESFINSII